MAEPQIRYARTSDGVNIAFGDAGEGQSLLFMSPPPLCHVQLDWDSLSLLYGRFAEAFRLVWFDWHGTGMSDRDVSDFSFPAMLRDVDAVVDRARLDRFAIVSYSFACPMAVSYAAEHPERVGHLILYDGAADPDEWRSTDWAKMEVAMRDQDWTLYTEATARVLKRGTNLEEVLDFAEYLRSCVDQQTMRRIYEARVDYRVAPLLSHVDTPTLVAASGRGMVPPVTASRRLASEIPNAIYRHLEEGIAALADACIDFILGEEQRPKTAGTILSSSFRTVLFTDLVGHTEMMQRLGDDKGRDVLREHERITRETLQEFGGAEVKTMGDGFMASFGSVTKALDCAIALQRAFAVHEGEPLQVRVGLNAGEPIEEDGDLFGSTVILASRIAAQAGAGEILIPEPLRHLLSGKSYVYSDRGEVALKGFEDAVRLYEVRWRE